MTADEARALRHSGAKCVPREPLPEMVAATHLDRVPTLPEDVWLRMYDAAPACECEAERLLRELVEALDGSARSDSGRDDVAAMLQYGDVEKRVRAYLARAKP